MKKAVIIILAALAFAVAGGGAPAETVWYVDDNAPGDPVPGDPATGDPAEDGSADHPFDAIQEALDAAANGHTIIVRDGTYTGTGNRDIDFVGKAVHLRSENGPSNCIIDAEGTQAEPHRGFYFHSAEGADSIVYGFTIRNGYADGGTSEEQRGGGIYCYYSSPTIANNIITGNSATTGGGMHCYYSSPTITNNTVTANTAYHRGGGICCYYNSSPTFTSSILWANSGLTGPEIYLTSSTLTVRYSDVAGGAGAAYISSSSILDLDATNINADPLFADPDNGDYHLKSLVGRWYPEANGGAGAWVNDSVTSLCIDAGDPNGNFSVEPEPNGGRINTGAYGNTAEASKSSHTLAVNSIPITGIGITGDKPGTTNYTSACEDRQVVHLTAPSTVAAGAVRYDFVRWNVDGANRPDGQAEVQVTMESEKVVVAEYAVRRHTLTVQSTPITGVGITGDKPGDTDYTATCDDQDVVSLTAPEVVWRGDDSYIFIRWKRDEADQMPGQTTVQIRMAADHRVQAVYRRMGSVYIEGPDDRGEGPLPIGGGEFTVDIYAEDMLDFAGFNMALEFALNDAIDNFPIAMGGPAHPFDGMKIIRNEAFLPYVEGASNVEKQVFSLISKEQEWIETGIPPMFGHWGDYTDKTITGKTLLVTVTLECTPADPGGTYTIGSHTPTAPDFEERTTFGSRGETGIEAIPFEVITGSVTITAPVTHTLAVQSAPIAGFAISGDKPGATDYTATCDDLDEITLTAQPSAVGADGNNYTFLFWSIDNQDGILHETSALLLMDRDHNAEAVYNLLGDSNADCIVNVLDLLFVRNRLQGDPTSGDNWRADINGDGVINILDLLGVRNELQTGCGG